MGKVAIGEFVATGQLPGKRYRKYPKSANTGGGTANLATQFAIPPPKPKTPGLPGAQHLAYIVKALLALVLFLSDARIHERWARIIGRLLPLRVSPSTPYALIT